jgi:hypothetical protein
MGQTTKPYYSRRKPALWKPSASTMPAENRSIPRGEAFALRPFDSAGFVSKCFAPTRKVALGRLLELLLRLSEQLAHLDAHVLTGLLKQFAMVSGVCGVLCNSDARLRADLGSLAS